MRTTYLKIQRRKVIGTFAWKTSLGIRTPEEPSKRDKIKQREKKYQMIRD